MVSCHFRLVRSDLHWRLLWLKEITYFIQHSSKRETCTFFLWSSLHCHHWWRCASFHVLSGWRFWRKTHLHWCLCSPSHWSQRTILHFRLNWNLLHMHLLLSFLFVFLELPIHQLLPHAQERSILWEHLVFDRIAYRLLFEVLHLYVQHLVLDWNTLFRWALEGS